MNFYKFSIFKKMLKLLQYSFRILAISFGLILFENTYYIVSLYSLLFFDIISSFYYSFYFQFIFIISFFIGFLNLFYTTNTIYSGFFFLYSIFLSVYYFIFYNFLLLPKKNNDKILNYLESLENVLTEEECYICLETNDENKGLKYLPCSHTFHPSCLLNWFESQKFDNFPSFTCPVCKKSIFIEKFITV